MTIESTISRASVESEQGRPWRAKEILGSSIANYGYSRELFYALANVLLEMGEDFEAGKFLLLSVDRPSNIELESIQVFLNRFKQADYRQLLSHFPAAARLRIRDDYPAILANHFRQTGAPEILATRSWPPDSDYKSSSGRMFWIGCLVITFLAITCSLVGAFTILSWIFSGWQ